jgi:hypothetical protein
MVDANQLVELVFAGEGQHPAWVVPVAQAASRQLAPDLDVAQDVERASLSHDRNGRQRRLAMVGDTGGRAARVAARCRWTVSPDSEALIIYG